MDGIPSVTRTMNESLARVRNVMDVFRVNAEQSDVFRNQFFYILSCRSRGNQYCSLACIFVTETVLAT